MKNFDNITIGQLVDLMSQENTDLEALVYPELGLKYTYEEFRQACNQAAKGLMKLGVQTGEHIAIWANNVPQWVITQFGSAKMGAVLVTVNTSYQIFELEYLLKQSDSTTLILMKGTNSSDYISTLYELCPELYNCKPGELKAARLPFLRNVVVLCDGYYPGMFSWDDMLEMGCAVTEQELTVRQASLNSDAVINMMYTSGTTGFPKGVMLTHKNLIGNACSLAECMNFTNQDRLCIPVPFFHCFGCVLGTMTCMVSGAAMVPVVVFNPVKVLEAIQEERCTAVHGVPTMFIMELEELEKGTYDTSSLRTGIMAGSPCPIEVMKKVVDQMGIKEITITYGQTEASPGITMTRTDDLLELRVTTVGRALPNVEVKIVDPETGKEVTRYAQGELCSRGYNTMKGYYKMPEATAAAIDEDGWLHTGDLAVMDDNGYCKITGRLKDMIIRGGENIYPREIEEFLYTHPKVKDVQVVGVPSKKYGEEVIAFIQLNPKQTSTDDEIKIFCQGKIARYKIPKYVAFVENFPTTASGKIQKYKLRELAIEMLGLEDEVNYDIP